jgi:hypothetical protein
VISDQAFVSGRITAPPGLHRKTKPDSALVPPIPGLAPYIGAALDIKNAVYFW